MPKARKPNLPPLFTIGYEKAAQADVLKTLSQAGVELLIDVRDRPQSRRAGFSKSTLAASPDGAGRRYVPLKAPGPPPEGPEPNPPRQREKPRPIGETGPQSPGGQLD